MTVFFWKRGPSLLKKRMQKLDDVLRTIGDIQSFSGLFYYLIPPQGESALTPQIVIGISLLIAGLSQYKTLTLYHYRLIYDTVNFTGYVTFRR